jgi:DNA repair protein RadA/Sms
MTKRKSAYVCQECGNTSVNWRGQCPACGSWNSFFEETIASSHESSALSSSTRTKQVAQPLTDFELDAVSRVQTPDSELNRVLGGGIVPGSLILIGGEPGIGKSTLLLQLALQQPETILYVSGEESYNQIKIRASRVGSPNPACYLLPETALETVIEQIQKLNPTLVILDSIQTITSKEVESTAGSIPQIREATAHLQRWAKEHQIAVILVGHITKEGFIAGPKVLEHMVDTVLYFEGEAHYNYRILRTIKNRFGSVAEIGIYEMISQGLRTVENPSEILLSQRDKLLSGIAIAATLEGIRPMLTEIQALVAPTSYGTPQRATTGFDSKRLNMILAVLEKRCGLKLSDSDIFLNVAGGMKIEDPSSDLSVAVSLASSYYDIPVSDDTCVAGEIGLSGEIRPVQQVEKRINEAEKLGFKAIYISPFNQKHLEQAHPNLTIHPVGNLEVILDKLFK